MKRIARLAFQAGGAMLCAGLMAVPALAQQITQTFTLQPGWNAIYLEVEPTNSAPTAVFLGVPVASVWTWSERLTSIEFIQDPSEAGFNRSGWLGWFSPGRPEAFLSNLYAVQARRAYLIKLNSAGPVVWSVTGRPTVRQLAWATDAYNLRGFDVSVDNPPTFLAFFRSSKAHYNSTSVALENIYRLSPSGQWTRVAATDRMKRGEACWVYCRGSSDFTAPIEVQPASGDGVDFDVATEQSDLEFRNRTATDQTVLVQLRSASAAKGLAYRVFDAAQGGYSWPDLTDNLTTVVAADTTFRLRLAIRRGEFPGDLYTALLEISDGMGGHVWVPVSAQKPGALSSSPSLILKSGIQSGPTPEANPFRGLWVGGVEVSKVNEVNSANPTNLTSAPNAFPLRLLLHVDATGQARFLKEVIQMWRDGTYTNDAQGNKLVAKSGEYVLLTDERLLGQFKGSTLRDGVPVGRRLSTAGFDFDGGATNYLEMSGSFAVSNRLGVTITIGPNFPTNPFRHKYHPDHDNLDGRFVALTNNFEAYAVTRQIELEFTGADPTGTSTPDFGYSVMGGIYRETLVGLHKDPIRMEGTFRLTRACYTAELNPSATP